MVYLELRQGFKLSSAVEQNGIFDELKSEINFPVRITKPLAKKYHRDEYIDILRIHNKSESASEYIEFVIANMPEVITSFSVYMCVDEANAITLTTIAERVGLIKRLTDHEANEQDLENIFNDESNAASYTACTLFNKPLYWWD